jgi:hypothetical protein
MATLSLKREKINVDVHNNKGSIQTAINLVNCWLYSDYCSIGRYKNLCLRQFLPSLPLAFSVRRCEQRAESETGTSGCLLSDFNLIDLNTMQ